MEKTQAVDLHHGAGSRKKRDADRDANGREKRICDVPVCFGVHVSSHAPLLHEM
jgi:hypothetical protein